MSRSADVVQPFAGEDRTFRLPLGRLRALQEKCDCGPMELLRRFGSGEWRVDDLRETIHQGLLGGGMPATEAASLLRQGFDDLPLADFITLAKVIVTVAIIGAPDETTGELEGEGQANHPSPEASSGSQDSTGPAQ